MAELTAKLFRTYFGGSWHGRITKNGEFQREIIFNWPTAFEAFSSIGTEQGLRTPPGGGFHDDTNKVMVAGWRQDIKRWCVTWYNEFGGYGEAQWTSQDIINDKIILYGFCNESKQESDDVTNHIVSCQMRDKDHFKYTMRSFKKGQIEIEAKRIRTSNELNSLMKSQIAEDDSFSLLSGISNPHI